MQVFNVGALEILFILILAFIVLGPKKAIKTARDVGAWIRNVVRSPIWREIVHTSSEIREFPKKVMDDAELSNLIAELDLSTEEVKKILNQTRSETETTLTDIETNIAQEIYPQPSKDSNPVEDK
jgi:uncharacterized protein YeeX (DUF496 family)